MPQSDNGRIAVSDRLILRRDRKRRARLNVLSHILSKIPNEEPPRAKVELPKRQHRGDYKDPDYPFRFVPEVF